METSVILKCAYKVINKNENTAGTGKNGVSATKASSTHLEVKKENHVTI